MATWTLTIGAHPSTDPAVTVRHLHTSIDGVDLPVQDAAPGAVWTVTPVSDGQAVTMFVTDTNPTGDGPPGASLSFTVTPPPVVPPAPDAPFVVSQVPL